MTTAVNQHHVWQHHLRAWANDRGQVWCLQEGKSEPFLAKTSKVASKRFFYEVHELSEADTAYLEWVIQSAGSEELRDLHRRWIKAFQAPFAIRRKLANSTLPPMVKDALERELTVAKRTMGEMHHTQVENSATPILDALRVEDSSFYETEDGASTFIYFLSLQFFRTAALRASVLEINRALPLPHDASRTWPIEAHIYAMNMGVHFFVNRKRYRIVFLRNLSERPFITGDQPVISLRGKHEVNVELYYPLTPKLAMIYTPSLERFPEKRKDATLLEVETYNYRIYQMAGTQIFANDFDYLQSLLRLPKTFDDDRGPRRWASQTST